MGPPDLLDFFARRWTQLICSLRTFIVNLAQKGKLNRILFPQTWRPYARSWIWWPNPPLLIKDSLILFAAYPLPGCSRCWNLGARSYLIEQMADEVTLDQGMYSRQVLAILQYYLEEFPELLGKPDKVRILDLVARHGGVDLDRYQRTPFVQWKEDKQLRSLSLFPSG